MKYTTRGFSLMELLVTLALVGVAAVAVLPLASVMETRAKEAELRRALRVIRTALDTYKQAVDSGVIEKATGDSGYPPSLGVLTDGVPPSGSLGFNARPIFFLRALPRDPFYPDRAVAPALSWNLRAYGAKAGDFSPGQDVFDVKSTSDRVALDGSRYRDW